MPSAAELARQTVALFRKAKEANLATPGRRGSQVVLTGEMAEEVMVTADLHGQRNNFHALCRRADLSNHPNRHLVMQEVCHGGPMYPGDMGCMSHLLLEDVARLKVEFPDRLHFILSNHELAELTDFPISKHRRMLNLLFRCGVQTMYGEAAEEVRGAYCEFLASCPLAVRLENGVFISHSAPADCSRQGFDPEIFERELEPADLNPEGDAFRLVWGRDFQADNAAYFAQLIDAKLLIHGHEPCSDGFHVPNPHQVILDCAGPRAAFVVLPVRQCISQEDVVQSIERLA